MTNKGIELLKEFEGLRLKAYKPVATEKYFTIGYGHYGPDVTEGMEITKEEAERLLKLDVETFEYQVVRPMIPVTLPTEAIDALVLLAYNIGGGNFSRSTLLKRIKEDKNNMPEIEKQWNRWVYSGKTVLPGLVKRRKKEFAMYKTAVLAQYTKVECYDMGVECKTK